MNFSSFIDGARDGKWLTRDRAIAAGLMFLLAQATILVLLALWQHGVTSEAPSTTSSDFVSFYAAGRLALEGTPALAYDQPAHFVMQQRFTIEGAPYQFFFYPPVFLFPLVVLAMLPYTVAFYLFEIVTLIAFVLVMRRILDEPGWLWAAPVLAFPAVFWTFGLGQNAFLTATLFGGFTLLVERRPDLAGVLLGLVCYKPHFGLLAPGALVCGRHWRAFIAAGATVVVLAGGSALVFGVDTWRAYFKAFADADAIYGSGRIDYAGFITPFGAMRLLGFGAAVSYVVQCVAMVGMLYLTGAVWRACSTLGTRAATLLAATLLSVPLALLYDQMLLVVAAAWLVRDAREQGFLPWEKTVLAAGFFVSVVEYVAGAAWQVPLGPVVGIALLALAARRAWRPSESFAASAIGHATHASAH